MGIYPATIFLGAFLLFQVEPMMAKYLLPWFGGTSAVWTTCLLFFQTLLLAGYAYAHLVGTRLSRRAQVILHTALVGGCLLTMGTLIMRWKSPIMPGPGWKPTEFDTPLLSILTLLSVSIGLPYFALAATAPLLQVWFGETHQGASPYRLYALSNLGSLLALLTYPFVVEPALSLKVQAEVWSALYFAFALGMGLCARPLWRLVRMDTAPALGRSNCPPLKLSTCVLWLSLAACASLMLYGATNQLTENIGPIPFLWILPLALYLISFIICFDNDHWYRRGVFHPALALAIVSSLVVATHTVTHTGPVALFITRGVVKRISFPVLIASSSLLLFAVCMVCHGELVRLKPDRRHLTAFYLMVAAGGVLGGLVAVLVAPFLFRGYWEYPLAAWASAVLLLLVLLKDPKSWLHQRRPIIELSILAATLALPELVGFDAVVMHARIYNAAALMTLVLFAAFTLRRGQPLLGSPSTMVQFALVAAITVVGVIYAAIASQIFYASLMVTRDFYGLFSVYEGPALQFRSYQLWSGGILHGEQYQSLPWRDFPTTYYGPGSGVGLVMTNYPRNGGPDKALLRIGVVGLGAGTIAAWGRPGDYIRFYEIDPTVIKLATDPTGYFTYVRDSSAKVDIIPGDARVSMEREISAGRPQNFDVLVIDAFSGDAIPFHLLTREAMQIYLREMRPEGVLAIHISNRYLDLRPALAQLCRAFDLSCGCVHDEPQYLGIYQPSNWVLLARNDRMLALPKIAAHMKPISPSSKVSLWTDDYSNLFQVLQ